jgi:hypothetical protein
MALFIAGTSSPSRSDEEPGHDGAEAPATKPPFMQQIEIAFAPLSRSEA